jgi:hypothetical protein
MTKETVSEVSPMGGQAPVKTARKSFLAVSVGALSLVLAASAYLAYQVTETKAKILEVRTASAEYSSKIAELKSDAEVIAADLLTKNKGSIESSVNRSKAQDYVSELLRLHRDYEIDFDGFSFAGGKIATAVSARPRSGESGDPIDKTVRFISDFRTGSGSASTSALSLGEIRLVTGDEARRTFSVEFALKP